MCVCVYHVQAKDGFQFLSIDGQFSKIQSHMNVSQADVKGCVHDDVNVVTYGVLLAMTSADAWLLR